MLLTALVYFLTFIINLIFSIIPEIPNLPDDLINSIYSYFDLIISNGLHLIGLFIRPSTILALLPISIAIANLEYIYNLVIWLLKKLPIFNIK